MKHQTVGPVSGKLVHQLLRVVTLAYDLRLMHTIPRWKYLSEEYKILCERLCLETHVSLDFPKKCCLGPQNGFGSLGPEKMLKIVNCDTIKETKKMKEKKVGVEVE